MSALFQPTPEMKAYQPYGTSLDTMYSKDEELLMSGPAGTGKSRTAFEKIHLCCEKYPRARVLALRKTRESLTESGLVTYEEKVVPLGHPCLEGPRRNLRQSYKYPNGSELVVGGLDKPGKIMSTEYDLIYIMEAIETEENDWEHCTTRLRNGVMPYQQLIGDTNPDKPMHWLIQRCHKGLCKLINTKHEDNPVLFDHRKNTWTPAGEAYLAKLDRLTGPRKQRLRYGLWVSAEGAIYDEWDTSRHMVDRYKIPWEWKRYWVVDFGYTNPFVWQAWAENPDTGQLVRYREIYHTGIIVEDHAKRIQFLTRKDPEPVAIICDHDAEDRATLERKIGRKTVKASKTVSDGIQAVKERLRGDASGPTLVFMRDSLDRRDPDLVDSKKPTCTEEEMDGYVWDIKHGQKKGDQPVKENDHGCDAKRYMVGYKDLVKRHKLVFV